MKICEAIRKAYEKARLKKEEQDDGYDYVVPVFDKDEHIIFDVSSDGALMGFNDYDWKADDFFSNDWNVKR